ncbi:hypothetical protein SLS61_006743 [Didymella pomorum]
MPPKRMSDILASSSIDARISSPLPTAATDTSDEPTLPIIGATSEHGTKRKRATDAPTQSKRAVTQPPKPQTNTNHPSLYQPWTLLLPKQRSDIENKGADTVEAIVYSRNQNVRSGIERLLRVVGAAPAKRSEEEETHQGPGNEKEAGHVNDVDKMVVVSAQGEGTVKLVGIVDMVRRIVAEGRSKAVAAGKDGKKEGAGWYIYTVLSSVEVARAKTATGEQRGQEHSDVEVNDDEAEAMDIDDDGGAVQETQQSAKEDMKKVPVLSVWMSRRTLVGWKEAFGQEEMVVHKAAD